MAGASRDETRHLHLLADQVESGACCIAQARCFRCMVIGKPLPAIQRNSRENDQHAKRHRD
jgi:hypothetical protein